MTVLPMQDCTSEKHAKKTVNALTHFVTHRLTQKNQLAISSSKSSSEQFIVTMQLLQHDEAMHNSSELTISVHLKIVDVRTEKPQVVFQEVIDHNTLLEGALPSEDALNWQDPSFRVSPIGLAHAKVSREVATRIEDYIKLATKGNT